MNKALQIVRSLLKYYEKMLKTANQKPIDYAVGLRIKGQIFILENLIIIFEQEQKESRMK